MKLLAPCAGLAMVACLALGSTAEAVTKGKGDRHGVIALPVAYDKKSKRLSTAVVWWSTAHGGSHRNQLVTTDLDVVTPARLEATQARIKSRLESGELVERVREGFEDEIEGLKNLPGGNAARSITDQHLIDLLGEPGVRGAPSSLVGQTSAQDDVEDVVAGVGGVVGLAVAYDAAAAATAVATAAAATAPATGALGGVPVAAAGTAAAAGGGGLIVAGAGVAGYGVGMGLNVVLNAVVSATTDSDTVGDLIYDWFCGDSDDVGCGYTGDDGTGLPPDMVSGSAAGLVYLHLATGLGADELERQIDGLDIAGGADVGVARERTDLAAWLAVDARLGGEYLRQVERGLDARGGRHGVRDDVQAGGGIDPNQLFNYGRITPMPEMVVDVVGVEPR